jgi:hypothetical protein
MSHVLEFGGFRLYPQRRLLLENDNPKLDRVCLDSRKPLPSVQAPVGLHTSSSKCDIWPSSLADLANDGKAATPRSILVAAIAGIAAGDIPRHLPFAKRRSATLLATAIVG